MLNRPQLDSNYRSPVMTAQKTIRRIHVGKKSSSAAAARAPGVVEVELNPVLVGRSGATAVDALWIEEIS